MKHTETCSYNELLTVLGSKINSDQERIQSFEFDKNKNANVLYGRIVSITV
jgi:hypothetical protein